MPRLRRRWRPSIPSTRGSGPGCWPGSRGEPRFLADENVDPDLVLGLRRRVVVVDIVRVQDVGLRSAGDPEILQWAADEGRILVSHDIRTIPWFAAERLTAGLPMPGVILPRANLPIATGIDELAAVVGANEWEHRTAYLPLTDRPR